VTEKKKFADIVTELGQSMDLPPEEFTEEILTLAMAVGSRHIGENNEPFLYAVESGGVPYFIQIGIIPDEAFKEKQ